jgi:hypothetical protein
MAQKEDKGSWDAYGIQMRAFVEKMTVDELRALFWQVYNEDERLFDEDKLQAAFLASLTPEQAQIYRDLATTQRAILRPTLDGPWQIRSEKETEEIRLARLNQADINRQSSHEMQEVIHFVGELMDNVDEYQRMQTGVRKRTPETCVELFRRIALFVADLEAAYLTANPVEERDPKILFTFNHSKHAMNNASAQDISDEEDDEDFQIQQSDEEVFHTSAKYAANLELMVTVNFPQVVEDIKKCVLNGFINRLSLETIMDQATSLFNAMTD